jgi:hypothetical protein
MNDAGAHYARPAWTTIMSFMMMIDDDAVMGMMRSLYNSS